MLRRIRSCCKMTEQMAQMSEQLQQLGQQLSDKREMLQQIQETQSRPSDAHDFQTKAFSKMKRERSDETAWSRWVYKFRIEAAGCFRQVAAILDWAENRHDQSISESDIRQITVQAASIESPEKQRRTIEKSPQSNVHESGDGHTNVDAPAKTEGGNETERKKDARSRPKFIGHWFWCGAHGHTKSDCRKKAAGRPRTARSPTIPSRKGRDESNKGSERTLSFEKWPNTDEEAMLSLHRFRPADMKSTVSEIGKPGRRSRNKRFVDGNPTRTEDLVSMQSTPKWARESTEVIADSWTFRTLVLVSPHLSSARSWSRAGRLWDQHWYSSASYASALQ